MVLSALFGKVGTKDKDYMQLQEDISKISGGINASNHFYVDKSGEVKGRISLSSKFLPDNTVETTNLMFDILQNTDLEDKKRITELMFQNFMGFQQSIVENGHRFAMLGAASLHNKLSFVQENMGGLSAIASFAPYITQQDEMITNQLTKVKDFYSNLNKGKDEMLFISNHKLSSEHLMT